MSLLLKLSISAVTAAVLLIGGIFAGEKIASPVQTPQIAQKFGSFTPVGGQTYVLSGSGVTASQTTVSLTSFKTPDGRAITMTMLGTTGYAVIDPNSPTKIEDITFTGVTQNANGTAILTGVSRGMDFVSPYAASTTLGQAHAGGSYLALSNTAGFYGQQFAFINNPTTISSVWTFGSTTQPGYDANPASWASQNSFINKAYADALSIAGGATSTESNQGFVWLAAASQVGASTASSTTGSPLVIPNKYATTTPGTLCTSGTWNCIAVAGSSGKLSQLFLDLTAGFTFSTTTSYIGNFGQLTATSTASSSIQNLVVPNNASSTNLFASKNVQLPNGCTGCTITGGISTSTTVAAPTTSGATATANVFCVAPKVVVGGGFSGVPVGQSGTSGSWFQINANYPSASNEWTATFECHIDNVANCNSGTITVYALCVNP